MADRVPDRRASMVAIGQVAPENIPLFFKLSREIAAELVVEGDRRRTN